MKEYTYRKGTVKDVKQFQELGLQSYGQFKTVLAEEGWKKMEATCGDETTYLKLLEIAECFVCEVNEKIIGMAFLIPHGNPVAFFEVDWAYIRLVGVAPSHEGKGIGRRLTEMCVDFAKDTGEKTLVLHTSEFQNAARHIYESMGFKKFKELDPIFGKKYWLYKLDLDSEKAITYHKATHADLDSLVELRIQFTKLLTGIDSPDRISELEKSSRHYFIRVLDNSTGIWIIAKHEGQAVGTGGLLIRENPPNFKNPDGRMGYLANMYTLPTFRRKKICSKIIDLLVKEASQIGIKAFELHATKEGEFVYKQAGFEIHDEPTYRMYIK